MARKTKLVIKQLCTREADSTSLKKLEWWNTYAMLRDSCMCLATSWYETLQFVPGLQLPMHRIPKKARMCVAAIRFTKSHVSMPVRFAKIVTGNDGAYRNPEDITNLFDNCSDGHGPCKYQEGFIMIADDTKTFKAVRDLVYNWDKGIDHPPGHRYHFDTLNPPPRFNELTSIYNLTQAKPKPPLPTLLRRALCFHKEIAQRMTGHQEQSEEVEEEEGEVSDPSITLFQAVPDASYGSKCTTAEGPMTGAKFVPPVQIESIDTCYILERSVVDCTEELDCI
ncbi:hypothetical protein H4R35_001782 [Dimargaris xerosporica]|nr:hypothetical protein H4R35_001782 [Dimargaris xerosporica]